MQTSQPVAHADLAFEFMMNALRLTEGFALSLFNERTGLPLSTILPALEQRRRAAGCSATATGCARPWPGSAL